MSFDDEHGFTGKEYDPDIGLYYFNARWYDPEIGRFISEDPAADPVIRICIAIVAIIVCPE